MRIKKILLLLFISFVACASGCIMQSLNVFYTEEYKISPKDISGKWEIINPGNKVKQSPWTFSEKTIDTYDDENRYGQLEVVYFKIGKNTYIDFIAGDKNFQKNFSVNEYVAMGFTAVHSIVKYEVINNTLKLYPIDTDWLFKKLDNKDIKLPFIETSSEAIVFTATPEEWVNFLKEHENNEKLFPDKNLFTFKRVEK